MLYQPVRFEPRRYAPTSRYLEEYLSRAKERGGDLKGSAPRGTRAADRRCRLTIRGSSHYGSSDESAQRPFICGGAGSFCVRDGGRVFSCTERTVTPVAPATVVQPPLVVVAPAPVVVAPPQ